MIEELFRELEMTNELRKYQADKDFYHAKWNSEIEKILKEVNKPADASILKLDKYADDVARMCPNVDNTDDKAAHLHGASRNIEHILMMSPPNADDSRADMMGSLYKLFKADDDDEKKTLDTVEIEVGTKLANEYLEMPDILHKSFPATFPMKLEQTDLASSVSVHKYITERWLKNVDTQWARNCYFSMYEFSSRMRREASLAASIKFRGGKNVADVNKMLKRKNVLKDLKYAQEHPESETCKQLEKEFVPFYVHTLFLCSVRSLTLSSAMTIYCYSMMRQIASASI